MKWIRYTHNSEKIDLSYHVQCDDGGTPLIHDYNGERCVRIRTIANLYYEPDGRHIPAFSMLPVGDGLMENYSENPED